MIQKYIEYTKEHKEIIRKAYKDFLKPQYLGEDETIAVRAISVESAWKKMIQLEMETAGKTREEAEEDLKLEDISTGWLQLYVDDNNKNHENIDGGDSDDFVSLEETSDYPVFVYLI